MRLLFGRKETNKPSKGINNQQTGKHIYLVS
jgi:hypothetical protein